jgi:hypothetical protein
MAEQPANAGFVATTRVLNSRERAVTFIVEPWGDAHDMPPRAAFDVTAEAPEPGTLEVEMKDDSIIVWGWSGSVLTVFHNGEELGAGLWPRPAVPPLPPGQSTGQFLRNIRGE